MVKVKYFIAPWVNFNSVLDGMYMCRRQYLALMNESQGVAL